MPFSWVLRFSSRPFNRQITWGSGPYEAYNIWMRPSRLFKIEHRKSNIVARPLEQVRSQIEQYLKNQNYGTAKDALMECLTAASCLELFPSRT